MYPRCTGGKSVFAPLALLALLAVFSLAFAPAPLPKRSRSSAVRTIAGTVWKGVDSEGRQYTFRFLADGTLDYTSRTGTFRNGTWKQTGTEVYMETNRRFWEFTGVLCGGRLDGKASNSRGGQWTYELKLGSE